MARLLDVVGPVPLAALERLVHFTELVLCQQGAGHAGACGKVFDAFGEGGDAIAEAGVAGLEGAPRGEEGGGRGGEEDEEDECGFHGRWEEGVRWRFVEVCLFV